MLDKADVKLNKMEKAKAEKIGLPLKMSLSILAKLIVKLSTRWT